MNVKKYRLDIIVITALLLVALSVMLATVLTKESGNYVAVEINGTVTARYSLSKDGTYPLNGGTNTLVIEDGAAYLSYSNCPDHTCERTGKLRYVGQTAVCLPNKLSVTVRGESTDDGVDLIS